MLDEATIGQKLLDFETRFGRGGEIDLYFAPGRVNLIGEHTDYNGGLVLPLAVEQGTYLMIRGSELPPARLYSENRKTEARFHPAEIKRTGRLGGLRARGVPLRERLLRRTCRRSTVSTSATCPSERASRRPPPSSSSPPSGWRASAARSTPIHAVKVSRRAENDFVGVSCGVMDQFSIAFAQGGPRPAPELRDDGVQACPVQPQGRGARGRDTPGSTARSPTPPTTSGRRRVRGRRSNALSTKLRGVKNLSKIPDNRLRPRQVVHPGEARKAGGARHLRERCGSRRRRARLERGDAETLGHLMNRSHESFRDLFEVSSKELDRLQELSLEQPGVYGCRMTGGGFGGCVVALVEDGQGRQVPARGRRAVLAVHALRARVHRHAAGRRRPQAAGADMRVLVTGGAGYIGSVMVRVLEEGSHDVLVLDDLSKGHARRVGGADSRVATSRTGPPFDEACRSSGRKPACTSRRTASSASRWRTRSSTSRRTSREA